MANTIKKIHIKGSDLQYDYNSLANTPTIPSTVAELTDNGNYATTAYVESKISALPIDTEISSSSTNPVQNKVIKEYIDEGDKYPITYKTVSGSGTITAYKDATNSNSYDAITVNSRGGVVWIDRNYERLKFSPEFKSLNFSRADTRNITNMQSMFVDCNNLVSLDLSYFDTSKVTNMQSMFVGCNNLVSLDLSYFDTSEVTSMYCMFERCFRLTSLNLSGWNTSKVTNMAGMFIDCDRLGDLDLSSFDTTNVTDMQSMFYLCGVSGITLSSSFNTKNVTDMNMMFYLCSRLTSLDLSSFDTSKVTNMKDMFYCCSKLSKLSLSSSFFNSTALTAYDFSELSSWTDTDSLANLVSVLPTITTAKTIKLNTKTKAALTDEQKTTITTKGWTIEESNPHSGEGEW